MLIGADYLWSFQEGRTIRGEPNEPVAIESHLGWVLSGPLRGHCEDSQIIVNFVGHDLSRNGDNPELEECVAKLWDFETLRIREDNEVHEGLKDMWCPFRGKKELDPC